MRFVRYLNRRWYRIVALNKPTEIERGQWHFQRYIKRFPAPCEISLFDRSNFNLAVVEPVMGFYSEEQYEKFMSKVNLLEKFLVDDGIEKIKLWFLLDIKEQRKRFDNRRTNPLVQWKLNTVDAIAQQKFNDYTEFKLKMFERTSTDYCP